MKIALFILFFVASVPSLMAQSAAIKPDKMPEYPGGTKALIKLLIDSIDEPSVKREEADGDLVRIVLTFMIDEQGHVSDVQVVKSANKKTDERIVALVKKLKFIPGMIDGKPVKIKYTLPFEVDFGERTKY